MGAYRQHCCVPTRRRLSVAVALAQHSEPYAPMTVTLPWHQPTSELVTARLITCRRDRRAVHRTAFNTSAAHTARTIDLCFRVAISGRGRLT